MSVLAMDDGDKTKWAKFLAQRGRWVTEAVIVAIVAFLAALSGAWIALVSKDHELRIRLVEIGIGILRADPKDDVTPARAWAIKVIQQNSGVDFSEDEKNLLLHKPILDTGYYDIGSGYSDYPPDTFGRRPPGSASPLKQPPNGTQKSP
ncbi:MAG: hypothetical protein ACLPTZ_25400 [Beijerinckiaceae bacterium]